MIYRIFVLLVFVAVIVGSVMLGGQQPEAVSPTTVDEKAGNLGYAARNAQLIETGPDGRPLYRIDADLIHQPPDSQKVQLEQMKLAFRDAAGNQWQGRADTGVVGRDTRLVDLSGNVRISGTLPGTQEIASIATEQLSVDTGADTAVTREPVTLTWAGHNIQSIGLNANLKDQVVQLESKVHGTYPR